MKRYAIPTEEAVTIALRTQQVLADETGVVNTIDPLAGSYFVETLTNEIENQAWRYIERIDKLEEWWQRLNEVTLSLRSRMPPTIFRGRLNPATRSPSG